jgi:ribosome modulation factor
MERKMLANSPRMPFLDSGSQIVRDEIEKAAWHGYHDALAGNGFSQEYERQSVKWQRNYEIGRMWVVTFRRFGITPPPWLEGWDRPRDFADIIAKLPEKLNDQLPGSPLPPAPGLVFKIDAHPRRRR